MSLDPTSSNLFLQDPSAARISPDDKSRRLGMKRELSSRSEERGNQKQRRMDSEVFEESGDEENENENDLLVGDESMIEARAGGNGADGDRNKVADPQKGSARGVRACIVCRRLKMRCIPYDEATGTICKRCHNGGHECIFLKSMRGRRAPNRPPPVNKKEDFAKSLKMMEGTLASVVKSIGSYGLHLDVPSELPLPSSAVSTGATSTPSLGAFPPLLNLDGPVSSGTPSTPSLGPRPPLLNLDETATSELIVTSVPVYSASESGESLTSGLGVPATTNQETPDEEPRLHALPRDSYHPMGLLVEASQRSLRTAAVTLAEVLRAAVGDLDLMEHESPVNASRRRGIANAKYFLPGPLNIIPLRRIIFEHQQHAPLLLTEKIVTYSEVKELFELYFTNCQPALAILDPILHTPTATATRSPLLFSTICAVASRFYTKRTDDFYHKCLRAARRTAFGVIARGFKSPEICQAFLLLSHWNQPTERYEEERSYQFAGLACRMAQDLNLHRKTPDYPHSNESSAEVKFLLKREILNRERTWIACYVTDRGLECQMGKPRCIHREDIIIRNSKRWFLQPESLSTDAGVIMIVELRRIVSRILDALYCDTEASSGFNSGLDYPMMVRAFLGQLDQWREDWTVICPSDPNEPYSLSRSAFRTFFYHYNRLFVLSFAIHQATTSWEYQMDLPGFVTAAYKEARSLIEVVRDDLRPQGFLTYCSDSCFVYVCYACCFLLKLSSGAFGHLVDGATALQLVLDGAEVLESIAMDENHTPALYASFIRDLVAGGSGDKKDDEGMAKDLGTGSSPKNFTDPVDPQTLENFVSWFDNDSDFSNLAGLKSFETFEGMDRMRGEGFWDNMLLPGFGGPLQSSAGVYASAGDPWLFTPSQSRAPSPPIPAESTAFTD